MFPKHIASAPADERTRKTVFPAQVMYTCGKVENAENLLVEKPLQTDLADAVFTVLENDEDGEEATVVLDFGVELHGAPRLLSHFNSGENIAMVQVTTGESLTEAMSVIGEKNATNDHAPRDVCQALPFLGDITLPETGFRFLCIRLKSRNTRVRLKAACAVFIYRDIPYLGSFRCDRELLCKIYDTAAYTCHLNMQSMVWDGIKRDRLVWVGDMHPEMLTIRTVFGNQKVLADTLQFIREQTPLPAYMNGFPTYSLWWIMLTRDWYLYTGDEAFLDENYAYAAALLRQLSSLIDEDGTDHLPGYFLDWPSHERPEEKDASRALLAMALKAGVTLAGYRDDAALSALCEQKHAQLSIKKGVSHGSKQTAAMLSLAGWLDADTAAEEILDGGAKRFSTFMSFYLLTVAGAKDMQKALAAFETYYGGMLERGATTFWEDFNLDWLENSGRIDALPAPGERDIHGDHGAFCYQGFRHSLCHGWSSGPTAFLAESVLGIRILAPGCKKIGLAPNLGDLKWAEGTYPLPDGGILQISCKRRGDGTVDVTWDAPENIQIILL